MAGLADYIPPFLPTKPKPALNYYSFPNDLVSDGRQFSMDIQFMDYDPGFTSFGLFFPSVAPYYPTASYRPSGGITLPIPKKLNDIQTVIWQSDSAVSAGTQVASLAAYASGSRLAGLAGNTISGLSSLGNILGALVPGGIAVNPHLFMLFKSPTFKEYTLSWTLAPKNEQESMTLAKIIDTFKYNMLPSAYGGGGIASSLALNYPSVALIKMYPNDFFTFKFKPCVIKSIQIDHTGAGGPSFFKRTGAPTVVSFTLYLTEIQYLIKENYDL